MPDPVGTALNPAQSRVVDPIMTEHARGYSNSAFIGSVLFPTVDMPVAGMRRVEFDRSSFRRRKTRRAYGARIAQFEFGYAGKPVELHQEALRSSVPREIMRDAGITPGLDLLKHSAELVFDLIALEKEIRQAETARNAASYADSNKTALAGAAKWSDPDSKSFDQVSDAKEVVRGRTGRRPNVLVMGAKAAAGTKKNDRIREHFRPTGASAISDAMLATYFDVAQVVVGDAIYDRDDDNTVDVWGNDAILAYVPGAGLRNMALPSFGYTYQLAGHPLVESANWDNDTKSWGNDVIDEFSPELVGPDAGFLFQNVS